MKITLMGASLNSGNKGVNALTRGTINALIDFYGEEVDINIISYTPTVTSVLDNKVQYKGKEIIAKEIPCSKKIMIKLFMKVMSLSLLSKENRIKILRNNLVFKKLIESHLILDISEGDSFSDIYGLKRMIQHSILKIMAIKYDKNICLLPQTIGPFKSDIAKRLSKYIVNNVNHVFVRDMLSYDIVKGCNVEEDKVTYIPDMAFYMKPDTEIQLYNEIEELTEELYNEKTIIGLNVSALLYNGGYNEKNMFGFKTDYEKIIDSIIRLMLKDNNNIIVLVPHVIPKNMPVENDLLACKKIYEKYKEEYKNQIFTIEKDYAEHRIKGLIGKCQFFIGGRMHSCIAAASTNVPVVPIAYSRKFIGVWERLGLEECIADPRESELSELLQTIEKCFMDRERIQKVLEKKTSEYNDKIIKLFHEVD